MTTSDTSSTNANGELPSRELAAPGINVAVGTKLQFAEETATEVPFDRLCASCGYSLNGSPRAGLCPECGAAYANDEIVIPGWAAGPYENIATAAPRRVWRVALFGLIWMAYLWFWGIIESFVHHRITPAIIEWTALFLAIVACFIYRRWTLVTQFGCTAHLRLSPRGIGQRQGFGPVKLTPWASNLNVELTPRPRGAYLLGVWRIRAGQKSKPNKHNWLIAFEFTCSAEQAERLRSLVQSWIAGAEVEGSGLSHQH